MGLFKKEKQAEAEITFYDVANRKIEKGTEADISKYDVKDTVNLCIRERKGLSYEMFFLVLAIILIVILIIEFFGIYRPYVAYERLEQQYSERLDHLKEITVDDDEYAAMRDEYHTYNCESFPTELIDRQDILALLERTVFLHGKITQVSVSRNVLTLSITGVDRAELDTMQTEIREDEIVENVFVSRTGLQDTATASMTIEFKDAV